MLETSVRDALGKGFSCWIVQQDNNFLQKTSFQPKQMRVLQPTLNRQRETPTPKHQLQGQSKRRPDVLGRKGLLRKTLEDDNAASDRLNLVVHPRVSRLHICKSGILA